MRFIKERVRQVNSNVEGAENTLSRTYRSSDNLDQELLRD